MSEPQKTRAEEIVYIAMEWLRANGFVRIQSNDSNLIRFSRLDEKFMLIWFVEESVENDSGYLRVSLESLSTDKYGRTQFSLTEVDDQKIFSQLDNDILNKVCRKKMQPETSSSPEGLLRPVYVEEETQTCPPSTPSFTADSSLSAAQASNQMQPETSASAKRKLETLEGPPDKKAKSDSPESFCSPDYVDEATQTSPMSNTTTAPKMQERTTHRDNSF